LADTRRRVAKDLLQEIARDAFSRKEPHRYNAEARSSLWGPKFRPAARYDQQHAEHVRELGILLFPSMQAVHFIFRRNARIAGSRRIGCMTRVTWWGIAGITAGEYLALNGDIPALEA